MVKMSSQITFIGSLCAFLTMMGDRINFIFFRKLLKIIIMKQAIFSGIILSLFFSAAGAFENQSNKPDSVLSQELIDQVHNFESQLYDSGRVDVANFQQGMDHFDQLIEQYVSLDTQYPDSDFDQKAFTYLEKKKNLNLISLLSNGCLPSGGDNDSCMIRILDSSTPFSMTGKKLFVEMKKTVDISALQKYFLEDKEAILNFWMRENQIVVFIVTRDSLKTVKWRCSFKHIKSKINSLLAQYYQNLDPLKLEFDAQLSHELYRQLFQPLELHIQYYKLICIIPDGLLVGFPFELLVRNPTVTTKFNNTILYQNYSNLDYLVKEYAISYNYSAAFFALAKELDRATKKLGHRLLTLSHPIILQKAGDQSTGIYQFFSQPLKHNNNSAEEIKRVSRLLFRHDNIKKEQATEAYFLEKGRRYRWIYLALPGLLDNSNLLNSGLLFSPQAGDTSGLPGWLMIDEILHSTLSADLLTLSSTQVQPFNAEGNPGVIGLPQAFLFTGAKAVLFSLWPINNISTSQFMSKFYWELKYKRQTNSQALQEAKIASLKETFILDGTEISRSHPYFWATFQLVGNPKIRPPSPTKLPPWGVIVIVYVCVMLVALYITRKTMPRHGR